MAALLAVRPAFRAAAFVGGYIDLPAEVFQVLLGLVLLYSAAAVSALFILLNSTAGLAGNIGGTGRIPTFALALVAAAGLGGFAGSYLGSRRFDPLVIKEFLAVVLLLAGLKLILTR